MAEAPTGAERCMVCHPAEVAGYAQTSMAHSLRRAGMEPSGTVTANGSKITMRSGADGYWQTWENGADKTEYRVDYVVGSGNHASGYLVDIGGHFFQSPVAYYKSRRAYDLAPGFEKTPNPDFTRPISEECLLCHSGTALHIPGTLNWYRTPAFSAEAISCERCHGPVERHLADPRAGTIVNPAKLEPAARDSVCEQCHLFGAARVAHPGKRLSDFVAGRPLEETFTIYHDVAAGGGAHGDFKVISHAEQLARSACARNSDGRLWCGTCHNPHEKPEEPEAVAYYRTRCLECHGEKFPAADAHPAKDSNCLSCHMPRRDARDGGHTAFTDHRIQRRPEEQTGGATATDIAAWREPAPELRKRNLGIAYIDVGTQRQSAAFVKKGYADLTEVQRQFSNDPDFFRWIGEALLLGRDTDDAKVALQRALELEPDSALTEASLAGVYMQAGDATGATAHLERAVALDPLNLPAASTLLGLYQKSGESEKAATLSTRISAAFVQKNETRADGTGKTAEKAFKNIQVFQGLPAEQLIPAMKFMSASLGVECSFCHVAGHFEKDDKEEKRTARKMIRMMAELNTTRFEGTREVTCYSCHRGASKPAATADLRLMAQAEARPKEELPADLPTVEHVLARYVAAIGGADALRRISSRAMTGEDEGAKSRVELLAENGGNYALLRHSKTGDRAAGLRGAVGWSSESGHVHEMTMAETEFARMDADLQFPLHIEEVFPELRMENPEKVDGVATFLIVGTQQKGLAVKFYFEQSTGLLLREVRLAETPLGILPTQVDYADYRDVEGVKISFRVTLREPGGVSTIQFNEARQNVAIDAKKFERPASTANPAK